MTILESYHLMQGQGQKRLFFGIEVHAPWPKELPKGRIIAEELRHFTLAFLGSCNHTKLQGALAHFPKPPFEVGFVGKFDKPWFIPKRDPRLIAWHGEWLEKSDPLLHYQAALISWLQSIGFESDTRHEFSPHATICRKPENLDEWEKSFTPLPFFIKDIHLFESLGHSNHCSLWHTSILPPFVPLEHTADIAFLIYAQSLTSLFAHAQSALCFGFPKLLNYLSNQTEFESLEDVIIELNKVVSFADKEIGAPFKAVSFHGKVEQEKKGILQWEMIVDV